MSLAKSNRSLAEGFLDLAGRPDITAAVLTELDLSVEQVLRVLDQGHLLQHKKVLGAAIALRGSVRRRAVTTAAAGSAGGAGRIQHR